MENAHGKEPWKVIVCDGPDIADIQDGEGFGIKEAGYFSVANARRIVACVNALSGISTEALETVMSACMRMEFPGDSHSHTRAHHSIRFIFAPEPLPVIKEDEEALIARIFNLPRNVLFPKNGISLDRIKEAMQILFPEE